MARSELIGRPRPIVTTSGYRLGMKPANAGKKYPPEPLTREEVNRLLKACGRGYAGARNRALIVVLWRCGLRLGEALALHPKDLDLETGTISVLHGKGDKRRVVGIDPQACAVLEQWLEQRRRLGAGRGGPVFCNIQRDRVGSQMWPSTFRDALKRAGARAGIEKHIHPHGLRHTHASELAEEGVPVNVIRDQLGHTDLRTTDRYINHLRPGHVIAVMQARTWEPMASRATSPLEPLRASA